MKHDELEFDAVYQLYTHSYLETTGFAQPVEWFERHFDKWTFFGTKTGLVSVRFQKEGTVKITGAAGSRSGIYKGMRDVIALEKPTWCAVSPDLQRQMNRLGFLTPPAWICVAVISAFGRQLGNGRRITARADDSFELELRNVGKVRKVFVANKHYYDWLLRHAGTCFPSCWQLLPDTTKYALATWSRNRTIKP